MVAAQENVGNRVAAIITRPCVLGVFQSSVGSERFVNRASIIAENTRDEPHDGVDQDHRSHFSARKNIITDRNQLGLQYFDDPLVKPFITSTKQDDPGLFGQLANAFLIEPLSLGREGHEVPGRLALARTASAAMITGGAIKTIPGPPPKGRSSTCLCLPSAHERISHRSISTSLFSIARRRML